MAFLRAALFFVRGGILMFERALCQLEVSLNHRFQFRPILDSGDYAFLARLFARRLASLELYYVPGHESLSAETPPLLASLEMRVAVNMDAYDLSPNVTTKYLVTGWLLPNVKCPRSRI